MSEKPDPAGTQDHRLPEVVALAFAGRGGQGPVLDFGAGAGAVGERLRRLGIGPVEALDVSAEMLAAAAKTGVYTGTMVADPAAALDVESGYYQGVVSAGTFTPGHVGPEALGELVRITGHGGLICLSVHAGHFQATGFGPMLDRMGDKLRDLRIDEVRVFGNNAGPGDRDQIACIVSFHRA